MLITTTNTIVHIILIIWSLTLLRSILIIICGKKIFIKASKGEKTSYYPILNLFTMLEVCDISSFFGILFFVPFLNLIVLFMMSYKLGVVFNTSFTYRIGLMIFPLLFYIILSNSDRAYKLADHDYFKELNNERADSINLMTEEEIKKLNEEVDPENNVEIDSIFKSDIEMMEKAAPYKAAKIDLLDMDKLKHDSETDEEKNDIETLDL